MCAKVEPETFADEILRMLLNYREWHRRLVNMQTADKPVFVEHRWSKYDAILRTVQSHGTQKTKKRYTC